MWFSCDRVSRWEKWRVVCAQSVVSFGLTRDVHLPVEMAAIVPALTVEPLADLQTAAVVWEQ